MKSAFDTLAMINSRIVTYLEIGLCYYLTKQENYIWHCCVNTYCKGGTIVPPAERDPSVRDPHHHGQAADRV